MEHLKLFSTRINIPRLIRVCEEFHHWKELVFLYVQYDEYDNAAMVMMNHSPVAWEHVLFKDVAVKVSSVEVYYKAISFYLEEHPDLLNDLLKVLPLPACLDLACVLPRPASCAAVIVTAGTRLCVSVYTSVCMSIYTHARAHVATYLPTSVNKRLYVCRQEKKTLRCQTCFNRNSW